MKRICVIGLGDMGSGLARNLIGAGFEVSGYDPAPARMAAFADMGGHGADSVADAAEGADAAFVMVMNGDQARSVILGPEGCAARMGPGGIVLLTATIRPREAREIGAALEGTGVALVDSPVSGGFRARRAAR